jgi:hypothetical protein
VAVADASAPAQAPAGRRPARPVPALLGGRKG